LEQLKSLKTNGKRKNVWSIFLILKPKYAEDLTLDLSNKKNTDKNNQRKDNATQQVLTNRHLCTTHNQQQAA
jgi:hypothetical protein